MLDMAGFAEPGVPILSDPGVRRWDQFMDLRASGGTRFSLGKAGKSILSPTTDGQDALRVNAADGSAAIQGGTFPSFPNIGGFWFGPVVPASTNFAFMGNGTSQTYINAPSGGSIIFRINNGTSPSLATITATGLGINKDAPVSNVHVTSASGGTATVKEIIQGVASQTADLTQWQNSAATVLSKVDKDGYLTLPGGLRLLGYVSSAVAPTTTELPNSKDCAIHKDTSLGTIRLAFNDGGAIKTVVLA